jgi:hypothetical protein
MSVALAIAVALLLSMTSAAKADFSVSGFTASSTSSVAGAHPDLTTDLSFSTTPGDYPDGNVRDVSVGLPAGFVGDPTSLPQCAQSNFAANMCPSSTQVGVVTVKLYFYDTHTTVPLTMAVFNMEPRNDEETAEIAFTSFLITVHMPISVRTDSDYGLTATVTGTNRYYGIERVTMTLWGVPADPSHDGQRIAINLSPAPPPQIARRPFLVNPTRCAGPLTFTVRANSYQDSTKFSEASTTLPPLVGCEAVRFEPGFSFRPATTTAGAPSGFESVLTVPYSTDPDGRATATLRNAVVALPTGVTLSASAGAGLGSCDDAHLNRRSTGPAACPDNAKIGTAEFDVPALPKPLKGAIYQRQPLPGDLFRIVLVADGFGVHLKIPGDVKADPVTGQLTATFADTPQVPFRKLTLNFDGGQHAPLSNPPACGTYTTRAQLTPWSSSTPMNIESTFTIDQGCGKENVFAPGFSAGSENPTAGASTPFHLRITRDSGPALSTVDTVMPLGLLANIKSVPRCPEARAAAGTCGPESQVGRVTVGAGAGTDPLFLPQAGKSPTAVFLAGPYKGAPFSLSIVVPAQAGPFDLGTVVVRAGLYVDPVTAQATVKADPMPTILEGIPLNVRDLRVDIDRPGFTFNPTNCDPQAVSGTITSAAGQAVRVSSPFRVLDCDSLALSPNLDLALSGKGQTKDGKHPAVQATLTQPAGQSNLKQVKVTLPESLALDPENSQSDSLCEFIDGRKTIPQCPKSSIVGSVVARTPILDQPLTGPVYFIKNVRTDPKSGRQIRTLPTLATVLQGEGVTLVLRATSAVDDNGQLVTTFANIPDAPVSSFKLNINGGKKGILVISDADICKSTQILDQVTDGQNGATREDKVTIATPSCPLAVVGSSHTSSALKVKVGGLGAGKVTVSGKGLKKASRTLAGSTVATLSLSLSRSMRTALAHGHDVRVKVSVSFKAKGAKKAKKITKSLVIHGAKR